MFHNGKQFKRITLNIGDRVEFQTSSALLRDTYHSQVIGCNTRLGIVQISFPTSNGKLVLVPVGTNVKLRLAGSNDWLENFTVIDRTNGENRCLVLQIAYSNAAELINYQTYDDLQLLAVTSGKGGVGKTTFTINLAMALSKLGKRVCVLDASLGTANVDVHLGITARYNLAHVIAGQRHLNDILVDSEYGFSVLPGCSGLQRITELSDFEYNYLATEFDQLSERFQILIVDTGAGISRSVTNFVRAAGTGYLIITPEPSSITDAYALLKTLVKEQKSKVNLKLVVNRVYSKSEAVEVAERVQFAAERFLDLELQYVGCILEDRKVRDSIIMQTPVLSLAPYCNASQAFLEIAKELDTDTAAAINPSFNVLSRLWNFVK